MDELPEELLLQIFLNLKVIRKFVPPANAGSRDDDRERENRDRINALLGLCSMSKKYYRICQPILFSGFIDYGDHATTRFIYALLHKPDLTRNVEYIEAWKRSSRTSLWDPELSPNTTKTLETPKAPKTRWNNLQHARLIHKASTIWHQPSYDVVSTWKELLHRSPGDAERALIIALTPNVQHLSLSVSLARNKPSMLDFVGLGNHPSVPCIQDFTKLETICAKGDLSSWFESGVETLSNLPKLNTLRLQRHHWLQTRSKIEAVLSLISQCPDLKNLYIDFPMEPEMSPTQCAARLESILISPPPLEEISLNKISHSPKMMCRLIQGLRPLKRVSFSIDRYHGRGTERFLAPVLMDTFLPHCHSLEQLCVDFRRMNKHEYIFSGGPVGSLSEFYAIKTLAACYHSLLGDPANMIGPASPTNAADIEKYWDCYRAPFRLSDVLPRNLEKLILLRSQPLPDNGSPILWDLADDCGLLPTLRKVVVEHEAPSALAAKFFENGVSFVGDALEVSQAHFV
ncbi:hypothetical protein K505DRAFT_357356 [Melanomma pulvis-pyrius CBS 109.77]|uniref:F-box domain-containing protein n=1 Tax=Melanomma pulvis-pyrius CBS 109.77 TaxID=1314802 RepID=A0A6A6XPV9_9PLEO|nr:hypothetical protein K505DRAFT_357356 [Melanomma pulvis-pyrius CBS 109.77]